MMLTRASAQSDRSLRCPYRESLSNRHDLESAICETFNLKVHDKFEKSENLNKIFYWV